MPETLLRKRLTREESRAQTRERLLDAGRDLFIKVGIDAASLEEVAETAGYSRGAFYSNFATRDELVCAVLGREIDRAHQHLRAIFEEDLPPMERLAAVRSYYVEMASDISECMFWTAVRLYALRNPGVLPTLAGMLRSHYAEVASYVRRMYEQLGTEPPAAPEVVAFSLIAQAEGLAISRMVDPDTITMKQFQQALALYFDRLIGV